MKQSRRHTIEARMTLKAENAPVNYIAEDTNETLEHFGNVCATPCPGLRLARPSFMPLPSPHRRFGSPFVSCRKARRDYHGQRIGLGDDAPRRRPSRRT